MSISVIESGTYLVVVGNRSDEVQPEEERRYAGGGNASWDGGCNEVVLGLGAEKDPPRRDYRSPHLAWVLQLEKEVPGEKRAGQAVIRVWMLKGWELERGERGKRGNVARSHHKVRIYDLTGVSFLRWGPRGTGVPHMGQIRPLLEPLPADKEVMATRTGASNTDGIGLPGFWMGAKPSESGMGDGQSHYTHEFSKEKRSSGAIDRRYAFIQQSNGLKLLSDSGLPGVGGAPQSRPRGSQGTTRRAFPAARAFSGRRRIDSLMRLKRRGHDDRYYWSNGGDIDIRRVTLGSPAS
ncbi:hypothetical protein EDB84DRAFT_1445502 [Lactarius hengduanensis]|nr:hypothetical protein EDB84DRAFT_1445502 [Lactarius hengduanensis]